MPRRFPSLFFFNDTATTEIYTLSLHDALPIWIVELRGAADELRQVLVRHPRLDADVAQDGGDVAGCETRRHDDPAPGLRFLRLDATGHAAARRRTEFRLQHNRPGSAAARRPDGAQARDLPLRLDV